MAATARARSKSRPSRAARAFHGSAFEYLRNDLFNARSWEQGADPTQPKAPYKKHDFGYTVGGPVFIPHHYNSDRNKTFFFWSQEWRREKNPSTVLQNVPSDAERAGDFSDICPGTDCPNVANPAAVPITPVGSALLSLIPTSNTTNGINARHGAPLPAFTNTISLPTTWREELVRVDHNITDNYRLTFRYIHDSWSQITNQPLWGVGSSSFQNINTNFVGPGTSFVARLTANITPTLLNEFVASYTADHIDLTAINNPALPGTFPMGSLFANGFGGKLPSIAVNTNTVYGGGFSQDTGYFPWTNANPVYTYRDNLTKIFGKHTFIFGVYFAAAQKNEENTTNVQGILTFDPSSPISTGNAFADLLVGNVANYSQGNQLLKYYNRYKIVEPYFQDDWRVTKKLTLNLGLRVSFFGTYRERYQSAFSFTPACVFSRRGSGHLQRSDQPGQSVERFARGRQSLQRHRAMRRQGRNGLNSRTDPDAIPQCNCWSEQQRRLLARSSLQSCASHRICVGSQGRRQDGDPRRIRHLLRTHQRQRRQQRVARRLRAIGPYFATI